MGDTLVIDGMGYRVGKSGLKIVVYFSDGRKVERSVLTFSSLVLGGNGSISLDALKLLSDYNIPVVFMKGFSVFATCHPFFMHGDVITRREQLLSYYDNRGVMLAKGFVFGAIANKSSVLRYFARNRDEGIASVLVSYADKIDKVGEKLEDFDFNGKSLDDVRLSLMGFEGEASKLYYEAFRRIIPNEFGFDIRSKRPPRDPVNSLLSYGYIILNSLVAVEVAKAGLEPFAGFLHADRSGKPSLVLDVSELFRQPIIDVVVASLFSRGWVNLDDFEFRRDGSVFVSRSGKEKFFKKYRERLSSRVRVDGVYTSFEGAVLREVRKISRFFVGRDREYKPFVFRWW